MAPTARNNRYGRDDSLGQAHADGYESNDGLDQTRDGYGRDHVGNTEGRRTTQAGSHADAFDRTVVYDRTGANSPYSNVREPYEAAGQTPQAAGNPYIADGNSPYANARETQLADPYAPAGSPYAASQNPYVSADSPYVGQDPRTVAGPSKAPVPSPPQQNPYLPQGSQGPVLRRRKAKGRVATPASRYDNGPAAGYAGQGRGAGYSAHGVAGYPGQGAGGHGAPAGAPKAPRPRRQRKPATHGCAAFFLWLIMLAALALMSLRLIPASLASGRVVPEAVSFVPLALIPSAICLALALLWRRRLLAIVCMLALAVNGYWHAGYFVGGTRISTDAAQSAITSASTSDNAARIMTLNTLNGAASAAQIVQVVREQHVEVLCLQELTDGMVSDLEAAGIDELLPYHVVSDGASAISNGGRNGIWTAAAQDNISTNLLPIQTSSMPAVSITVGSTTVRIVSVHPNSPVRGAQDLWDEGLSTIGSLSDYNHAYLIMGDFNSTWDHARFRELLGTTFADAGEESGQGFHMTYPSNSLVPSLIEIDHIVYSRSSGIVVSSLETVTISGTDHKALLGTLEAQ